MGRSETSLQYDSNKRHRRMNMMKLVMMMLVITSVGCTSTYKKRTPKECEPECRLRSTDLQER